MDRATRLTDVRSANAGKNSDRLAARLLTDRCVGSWWDLPPQRGPTGSEGLLSSNEDVCARELFSPRYRFPEQSVDSLRQRLPHFALFGIRRELALVPGSYLQSVIAQKFSPGSDSVRGVLLRGERGAVTKSQQIKHFLPEFLEGHLLLSLLKTIVHYLCRPHDRTPVGRDENSAVHSST